MLVDLDRDPVAHQLGVRQAERLLVGRLAEQALAAAQYDGEDHQPQLVDEIVLEQRVNQLGASGDQDHAVDLVLQLLDLLDDVAAEDRRVVPVGLLQRRRDHVLRHRVHLVREADLVAVVRPRGGEALVGHAPEQLCVGLADLVQLEGVAFVSAVDLERPTAVLVLLASAGSLYDSVERDELCDDDLAHDFLLRLRVR